MQPITAKPCQNMQTGKDLCTQWKKSKGDEDPVIKQHLWFCDGLPDFED